MEEWEVAMVNGRITRNFADERRAYEEYMIDNVDDYLAGLIDECPYTPNELDKLIDECLGINKVILIGGE